jgi:hypothetical protein
VTRVGKRADQASLERRLHARLGMLPRLEVARLVEAPAAEAWSLLVDPRRFVDWSPSVTAVETSSERLDAHSRGRVRLRFGPWLPFSVDHFEDGRSWSWKVAGLPATGHRVEPVGPCVSRVVVEVPLFAWPYLFICGRALDRLARLLTTHAEGA